MPTISFLRAPASRHLTAISADLSFSTRNLACESSGLWIRIDIQYNAAYFAMLEKDTNSGLNTMQYRNQQVLIGNIYRQDFFKPGYTIQASFHYDKDDASFQYDTNHFLVRPAPIGAVKPHAIRSYLLRTNRRRPLSAV